MTVFKSFFKIMLKNKGTIILYTVLLVLFGGLNYSNNDNQIGYQETKPDIIINDLDKSDLSKNLVSYLKKHTNVKDISGTDEVNDAIFYREANYYIEIYKGYEEDILNNNKKELTIKSSGDYMSSLTDMMVNRYLNIQDKYAGFSKRDIITNTNKVLDKETKIEIKTKLNTTTLMKMSAYYNFASYTILAAIVLVITLVMSSYNTINIKKRINVSSININKYNNSILFASSIYALCAWLFYNLLAIILIGSDMISIRGLILAINSLLFTITSLTLAILISSIVNNKNAINGIVNVLAVGSSFLCGVFVPTEWLGDKVLLVGHIFPTFYYVDANNLVSKIEDINMNSLKPIFTNYLILILFIIGFIICNRIIVMKKREIK